MIDKATSCKSAVEMIPDGASLMIGGFMGVGSPHRLIDELVRQGRKNLTVIANDSGRLNFGIGRLIAAKLIKKMITSHIGLNPETQRQMLAGEIEVELCPQGTLAERIRSGGFGLGGVLTATGIGTVVAEGKRTIEVDGKLFLLELPLSADFALLAAHRSDYRGNLEYSADGPQLQHGHGDGRKNGNRRARAHRSDWGDSTGCRGHPICLRPSHHRKEQLWTVRSSLQSALLRS